MSGSYEGRDLLRTQDIYGSQSSTAVKNRNIDQEKYVPEVIKNLPDVYQRQADLHKNIRNPHYNDYRYDLKQQHPQFVANSLGTEYNDSLDSFKHEQEVIKNDILRNNSQINYDYIRTQKNKNSYQKLNPPFANLHSEVNDRLGLYSSLKSPLMSYLQNTDINENINNINHQYTDIYSKQQSKSINQSPMNNNNSNQQLKINMNRSASQANIYPSNNYSAINTYQPPNNNNIFKPEEQSPINNNISNKQGSIPTILPNNINNNNDFNTKPLPNTQRLNNNDSGYLQSSNGYNQQQQQNGYGNQQQIQQQQLQQKPIGVQPYYPQDSVIGDAQQYQKPQIQQQQQLQQSQSHQNLRNLQQQQLYYTQQQPQPNQQMNQGQGLSTQEMGAFSSTPTQRKTYKPYNIIIHNRYVPYTPKFDLPDITWDKYDRQMFRNFDKKQQPPVEIMRKKNDQMNTFQDYSTWNQQYGEAK